MLYSEKLKPKLIKAGMRHIRNECSCTVKKQATENKR